MIGINEIMKLNDLLYMIYVIFSEFKQRLFTLYNISTAAVLF